MPPFSSTSKAVGSLISRRIRITHFVRNANNGGCSRSSDQIRCVSTISGSETLSSHPLLALPKEESFVPSNKISDRYTLQKRRFLGCGDGEEGGALSKVHEEKIIMGYSPEQLFDVVAAVDLYHGFVPWCQRSDIVKQYPNGSFDAELEIGFKFLLESYVSRVELSRPKFVKSTVSESTLFDHLINIWEFNPGPVLGTCNLHFLVDFKFQSPLYRQVASMFFKEVVSRLVSSFSERCRLIYGPAIPVLENSYGERT
ncbi:coenzyme Q-binding protein COQ10-like protein, mitochondrial-like [Gossypium australe]|uniref:Coenzyme Q-binding protein COQ10-like protein, mitochondrial-like n=1 Tax=Gossypium australe TaxID=47621 RepID=A0A5B6W5U4_9ROSI|nr:coenzyme Q-binding protein COQ10-like protein, mitochondrial-like [Gossypium australe]